MAFKSHHVPRILTLPIQPLSILTLSVASRFLGIDSSTQSLKALVIDTARSVVCEAVVNFARDLPHYGTTDGYVRGADARGGADGLLEVTAPSLMFVEALEMALERLEQQGLDFGRVRTRALAASTHWHTHQFSLVSQWATMQSISFISILFDIVSNLGDFWVFECSLSLSLPSQIAAVSVSGQQHGSVWWARGAADALRRMSAEDANSNADTEPLSGASEGAAINATSAAPAAAKARLNMHETLRAAFSLPSAPIWMDSSTARECREIEAEVQKCSHLHVCYL